MRRRDFITVLGGAAAVSWPLVARAQQPAMPVVGFLGSGTVQTGEHLAAAFRKGLTESGFVDGRNVTIEYRWQGGQYATVQSHLADLLKLRPAVMIVGGIVAAKAAQAATQSVPVLFTTAPDPVAMGLVASHNRPGGNLTGFSLAASELTAKQFGLLHELLPTVSKFAFLVNPDHPNAKIDIKDATDGKVKRVYFPHSGAISLVVEMDVGDMIETAMVGRDGVHNAASALDGKVSLNKGIVQLAGVTSVIDADKLRTIADKNKVLRSIIIRHEQVLLAQSQQSAACNASHSVEARMCRWLMRMRDLADGDEMTLTQEFLAQMLGVRRSSVSIVAGTLQKAGFIRYRRGNIRILDLKCSLSDGHFANSSASCIAACSPSSGMTRYAGA